jgi:S-adenosylmethionine decarboxylase
LKKFRTISCKIKFFHYFFGFKETNRKEMTKDDFNPVEKNLNLVLLGCNPNVVDNEEALELIKQQAVNLSGATVVDGISHKFEPQGVSGATILSESDICYHTSPQHSDISPLHKGVATYRLSTCGNTCHSFLAVGYIMKNLDPAAGRMIYAKGGLDQIGGSKIFPRKLEELAEKYKDQFDTSRYEFAGATLESFDYRILFWDTKLYSKDALAKTFKLNEQDMSKYIPLFAK